MVIVCESSPLFPSDFWRRFSALSAVGRCPPISLSLFLPRFQETIKRRSRTRRKEGRQQAMMGMYARRRRRTLSAFTGNAPSKLDHGSTGSLRTNILPDHRTSQLHDRAETIETLPPKPEKLLPLYELQLCTHVRTRKTFHFPNSLCPSLLLLPLK